MVLWTFRRTKLNNSKKYIQLWLRSIYGDAKYKPIMQIASDKQCAWVAYLYLIAHPSDPQVQQIANTLCSWSCLAQSCGMCSKFYLLLVNKYASGFPQLLFVLLWHAWIVCGCWSRVDKIQGIDIPPYTTIFVKHPRNVSTPLHMFLKQIIK